MIRLNLSALACLLLSTIGSATQAQTIPAITSLCPAAGPVGATVTINGSNFGSAQGTSSVVFDATHLPGSSTRVIGGIAASVTSWSDTTIVATVPSGATTGNVFVVVGSTPGTGSNGEGFVVFPAPAITGLSLNAAPIGANITITGTYLLGPPGTSSSVTFGGVPATSTSNWTATSIVAQVPSGVSLGTANVVVAITTATCSTGATTATSNSESFTVIAPPSISGLSPTSGPVGSTVTIAGSGFGSAQGTSTVTFNGTAASPTSWSSTSIVTPVPVSAATGNVVVTLDGVASTGVNYTVTDFSLSADPLTVNMPATGSGSGSASFTATPVNSFSGTISYTCSNLPDGGTCSTSGGTPVSGSAVNGTVTVTLPQGATGSTFTLIGTSGAMQHSVTVGLTVNAPPIITSLSPTSGVVGASVTISGVSAAEKVHHAGRLASAPPRPMGGDAVALYSSF